MSILWGRLRAGQRFFALVFAMGVMLSLAGCGGGSGLTRQTPPPPAQDVAITMQPLSQTVPLGETATFSVTATGTAPLSYQWSENGTPIPGAISSTYTTPTVELGADGSATIGSFQVAVSDAADSVTSSTVTLTAGPRSPKAGDLRYLVFQQVSSAGLSSAQAESSNFWGGATQTAASGQNAVGSPIAMGGPSWDCNSNACTWQYSIFATPPPATGLGVYYQGGTYTSYAADLKSYAASNVVFNSLDLEPGPNAYGVSWVTTTQPGGFDFRMDPVIAPGPNQQAQIQAQATQDGTESRVITAVSFDAAGNAVLISYGWQGDTTTVYETQAMLIPLASDVKSAATSLAGQGYIISAFGGNDVNGYVMVGMRVKGDSLPRTIGQVAFNSVQPPYPTPVVFLSVSGVDVVLSEQ